MGDNGLSLDPSLSETGFRGRTDPRVSRLPKKMATAGQSGDRRGRNGRLRAGLLLCVRQEKGPSKESSAFIGKGSEEWEPRKRGFTLTLRAWARALDQCEHIPVSSNQG